MRGNSLAFLADMVVQAVQSYRTHSPPRLPVGFRLIGMFETATDRRLGFIAESRRCVVIAFRGTEKPSDLIHDLDLSLTPFQAVPGAGMTHKGFTSLYMQIRKPLMKALSRVSPGRPLWIGGHSLGGALATMAALDLATQRRNGRIHVVTFGSPRVGNSRFVSRYNTLVPDTRRVYNVNDLVPHFPPEWLGYRSVRGAYAVRFDLGNPLSNHAMRGYAQAVRA